MLAAGMRRSVVGVRKGAWSASCARTNAIDLAMRLKNCRGKQDMRGIVFRGNCTLELATFPDPTPGIGEVVVEIKASGMRGSDLHFYHHR